MARARTCQRAERTNYGPFLAPGTRSAPLKALDEIAADFHKLHPDIIVKPQAMGWLDLELKVITALAAGNPPEIADTFVHHAGWAAAKTCCAPWTTW